MTRELITSWTDYTAALDRLLALAENEILIQDDGIAHLGCQSPARIEQFARVLRNASANAPALRITLRQCADLRDQAPRLVQLLMTYSHRCELQDTAPTLSHLRDGMIIADRRHALIRLERDMPRSKLLVDEPGEAAPYLRRFDEIWNAGGHSVSMTMLGL